MKFVFALALILVLVYVQAEDEPTLDDKWIMFKQKFGKTYKFEPDNQMRKQIFGENLKRIEDYNKKFEAGEVATRAEIDISTDQTDDEITKFDDKRLW